MVLQMRDTWSFQSSRIGSSSTGVRTTTTLFHQLLTCRITGSLLIAHRRQQDEPVLSTEAPSGSCAPYSSGTASRGVPSKRSTLSAEVPLLMFINRARHVTQAGNEISDEILTTQRQVYNCFYKNFWLRLIHLVCSIMRDGVG